MELEKFIAEDIVTFLDRKLHERASERDKPATAPQAVVAPEEVGLYSPTKDFEREMAEAIQDANRAKGLKLLDELKQQHDSFPADAPERLERKRLMEQLYRRFQEAFGHETEEKPPIRATMREPQSFQSEQKPPGSIAPSGPATLRPEAAERGPGPVSPVPFPAGTPSQVSAAPVAAGGPDGAQGAEHAMPAEEVALSAMPGLQPGPGRQEAPEPAAPHGLSEADETAIHADLEQIAALIEEESYPEAMHRYHTLKDRLAEEDMTSDQRESILSRMKGLYTEIAKPLAAKVGGSEEETRFHEHAHVAEAQAAAGDLPEAMREFNAAKALCDSLADPEKGKETLKALYDRIRAAEPKGSSVLDEEEKVLTGSP